MAVIFEHKKIKKGLWELIPKNYIIGESFESFVLDDMTTYFINDNNTYEFVNQTNFFYDSVGYPMPLSKISNDKQIQDLAKSYFNIIKRNRYFERVQKNGKKLFYLLKENNWLCETNIMDYYDDTNAKFISKVNYDEKGNLDLDYLFDIIKPIVNNDIKVETQPLKKDINPKPTLMNREKYDAMLDLNEAYNKLREIIISQDDALKKVLLTIKDNLQKMDKNYKIDNILLIGPTGVGKTLIAHEIAKILKVPFVSIDSNNYTPTGYVGSSLDECLESLYLKANGDLDLAERGIVFIDEIDKLAIGNSHDYIKTAAIQDALLTMLEGQEYNLKVGKNDKKIVFNTSKVTFMAAGAFSSITSPKLQNNIGFASQNTQIFNYKNDIDEKLIKYGMKDELVGRLSKILLESLKVEDVVKIILSKNSIFNYYLEIFKDYNIQFEYQNNFIEALAQYSMTKYGGARGINQVIKEVFSECQWKIYTSKKRLSKLIVDEKIIEDPKKYILR